MPADLRTVEQRIYEASEAVDAAIDELERCAVEAAKAEALYRQSKAQAFLHVTGAKNVAEREALAEAAKFPDVETGEVLTLTDVRYRRDLAEGLHGSAMQALKARTQQLSALQTLASKERAEAELARVDVRGAA